MDKELQEMYARVLTEMLAEGTPVTTEMQSAAVQEARRRLSGTGMAEGGRVELQEGGPTTYQSIVDDILATYPEGEVQEISRPSPQVEALQNIFGPQLAAFLGTTIDPRGGTSLDDVPFGSFLPTVSPQTGIQQQAVNLALGQAGFGPIEFDEQGLPIGDPARTGLAGFEPFLQDAGTAAGQAQAAALAGQGAGAQAIQNALNQANLAGLAAIAGQDAGQAGVSAAQNVADQIQAAATAGQGVGQQFLDRAAQLTGPRAFESFMSPYQEQVIDTTRRELEQQLQRQQAELGASAGAAFGGGRFGLAESQLASAGATGIARTLAGLRQQGFQQAQQAAARALQEQLGLGQFAQQQAGQNVGLLGQALAGQLQGAGAAQQQAAQNIGLFGAAGGQQLQGAQAGMAQAGQNVGLLGQAAGLQQGLAALQPQLASQNIGLIGQIGAQQQAQAQAIADTQARANQMIALMPQQRLGFFGSQLTGIGGGYPAMSQYTFEPAGGGPSPLTQTLGIAGTLGGLGAGLSGLYSGGGGGPFSFFTGGN